MAVHTQPGEWTVRFEVEKGLAEIPETAEAQIGLMDGLGVKCSDRPNGIHKKLDLARSPSGSSMDTTLNSPQGSSSASTGTGTASASGVHPWPSTSARAARRQKIEEIFFQFTLDDQEGRALATVNLGSVVRYLGHRVTGVELQRLTEEADQDGRGSLDFEEFLAMAEILDARAEAARILAAPNSATGRPSSSPAKSSRERKFRRIFTACMQPECQTIATKDLGVVTRLLGFALSDQELQRVAEEADEDDGGSLDLQEFLTMAKNLDEAYGQRDLK